MSKTHRKGSGYKTRSALSGNKYSSGSKNGRDELPVRMFVNFLKDSVNLVKNDLCSCFNSNKSVFYLQLSYR